VLASGDQRLQRWKSSDREGTSVLDSGDISVNGHGKLVLHPLRNVKPVEFMVEQP